MTSSLRRLVLYHTNFTAIDSTRGSAPSVRCYHLCSVNLPGDNGPRERIPSRHPAPFPPRSGQVGRPLTSSAKSVLVALGWVFLGLGSLASLAAATWVIGSMADAANPGAPASGFFNWMIYVRPRTIQWKTYDTEKTWWWAYRQVWKGETLPKSRLRPCASKKKAIHQSPTTNTCKSAVEGSENAVVLTPATSKAPACATISADNQCEHPSSSFCPFAPLSSQRDPTTG